MEITILQASNCSESRFPFLFYNSNICLDAIDGFHSAMRFFMKSLIELDYDLNTELAPFRSSF
jgi:hypothetical protein